MLHELKGNLLFLLRQKKLLFWALAFPLILASMFSLMFSGLDDAQDFKAVPVAVVTDEGYDEHGAFASALAAVSAAGDDQLLQTHEVGTVQEAQSLLADGAVKGYLTLDEQGVPSAHVARGVSKNSFDYVYQTILSIFTESYVRNAAMLQAVAAENPLALADQSLVERVLDTGSLTEQVTLTANKPVESVRYYYALLGMATLFAGAIAVSMVCRSQANLSPLGARRQISALGRGKTLVAGFLASWLMCFACLAVAYAYIRFALGVDFGSRDAGGLLVLVAASFLATALGSLIGAIPKAHEASKEGLLTGIACFASLFAGLYGTPTMKFADSIAAVAPWSVVINPAAQIAKAFMCLYSYDSLAPFFSTLLQLLVMGLVLLVIAMVLMRRQRYASI